MALIRNQNLIRLSPDDPAPGYLSDKVCEGQGIAITQKLHPMFGAQAIFNVNIPCAPGMGGDVVVAEGEFLVSKDANLVLIDASKAKVTVILPHPAEVLGWIACVCLDNSVGIELKVVNEDDKVRDYDEGVAIDTRTSIFDKKNLEFHMAGDAFIFASNRKDTWYCISRYCTSWYY